MELHARATHASNWIDFKELRAHLDFEQVLRHYKVEVKRKGQQHLGFCPLPNHHGQKNSPSFSANLERGIFQCFGNCGARGNVLEFAALMEEIPLEDGAQLRALAIRLRDRFCPELKPSVQPKEQRHISPLKQESKPAVPSIVNAPLDFELKGLDQNHPYLLNRGFTQDTINHFGLGFCSRGYLKNRIAIPLHKQDGKLVGYAGRVVDDATITEDNPRYKLPGTREREGKVFEFRKTHFLYNGYRITTPVERLIVVESFTAVWWLFQNGVTNVVGSMGSDCSDRQAELIVSLVRPDGQVWAMTDGDPAGERCALSILTRVSTHRLVRWAKLDEGIQPTHLSAEELKQKLCY